jgi:hypothetical protein
MNAKTPAATKPIRKGLIGQANAMPKQKKIAEAKSVSTDNQCKASDIVSAMKCRIVMHKRVSTKQPQ